MGTTTEFTPKQLLAYIYKANQCTDVNDVEIALSQLRDLDKRCTGYTPAMRRRLASLEKRKEQLL